MWKKHIFINLQWRHERQKRTLIIKVRNLYNKIIRKKKRKVIIFLVNTYNKYFKN